MTWDTCREDGVNLSQLPSHAWMGEQIKNSRLTFVLLAELLPVGGPCAGDLCTRLQVLHLRAALVIAGSILDIQYQSILILLKMGSDIETLSWCHPGFLI